MGLLALGTEAISHSEGRGGKPILDRGLVRDHRFSVFPNIIQIDVDGETGHAGIEEIYGRSAFQGEAIGIRRGEKHLQNIHEAHNFLKIVADKARFLRDGLDSSAVDLHHSPSQ